MEEVFKKSNIAPNCVISNTGKVYREIKTIKKCYRIDSKIFKDIRVLLNDAFPEQYPNIGKNFEDLPDEIWRVCPYNDYYMVSNLGRVCRKYGSRLGICEWRLINGSKDKYGQTKITMSSPGGATTKYLSYLVYETFVGEIPARHKVYQINNDSQNNNVNNLKLISFEDYYSNLGKRNSATHKRICITKDDIEQIRVRHKQGWTIRKIAETLKVPATYVSVILNCAL